MMNIKIKALFLALLLIVSVGLKAQEGLKKYEYVTVAQSIAGNLYVSYVGKPAEKIKSVPTPDHHELLEYVENIQNEGWQAFSTVANQ